jgi:hypothetical protein
VRIVANALAGLAGVALAAGCGSSPSSSAANRVITVEFSSGSLATPPATVTVPVGAHLAVRPTPGAARPPTSSSPRILATGKWTPPSCSPSCVPFTAIAPGRASIYEQAPCHSTRCTAALRVIPVMVKRGA